MITILNHEACRGNSVVPLSLPYPSLLEHTFPYPTLTTQNATLLHPHMTSHHRSPVCPNLPFISGMRSTMWAFAARAIYWYLFVYAMCKTWYQYIANAASATLLNAPPSDWYMFLVFRCTLIYIVNKFPCACKHIKTWQKWMKLRARIQHCFTNFMEIRFEL